LVEFLTGEAEQKIRAIEGAFMPTIESLYEDSDVQEAMPFIEEFRRIHRNVAARPSALTGPKYQDLSKVYWDAVSDILNGADAADRLSQAEEELAQVLAE
jgi:trehalose/maltose transport system substrate-binding protein